MATADEQDGHKIIARNKRARHDYHIIEAWEAGTDGLSPPQEIAGLLDTVAAGKELEPMPPLVDDPGATRLREMFETQRKSLIAHDPGARLGADPENLHQHRVAARRTRAFLRATRKYTDEAWRTSLEEPLRELGHATGPVRDLDVLIEHVADEVAGLDDAERAAGAALLARLAAERDAARTALVAALDGESYRRLLMRLRPPLLTPSSSSRLSLSLPNSTVRITAPMNGNAISAPLFSMDMPRSVCR